MRYISSILIVCLAIFMALPALAQYRRYGGLPLVTTPSQGSTTVRRRSTLAPSIQRPTVLPQPRNLPLYNPYFSINYGPLYEPYEEPCYYDETVGMWIGPCNTSLDTPGYSITVPNTIRR